ncbi:MAG: pirin family protein, partial [Planctomycetota bacterium]
MTTATRTTSTPPVAPFEQATDHPAVRVRPADARFPTEIGWLHSKHSFSFGQHQHPGNVGYRSLRVLNDDVVEPGQGFGEHPHRDMEILTWVLDGALKHGDSMGNLKELAPGELQAMTAGTGVRHSEFNASATGTVHFLQVWIEPRAAGAEPRYLQQSFDAAGRANRWQTLAIDDTRHADAPSAMPIAQDAELSVADVAEGATVEATVPAGRHGYLHLATGRATVTTADGRVNA